MKTLTLMIGNSIEAGIAKEMYEQGATKVHAVSDTDYDIIYVFGTWGKDEAGAFSRARRIEGRHYKVTSSDIVMKNLSEEKIKIFNEQVNDIIGYAVDKVHAEGKLFFVERPIQFYLLPKDDKLIQELDRLLETFGLKKLFESLETN